MANLGGNVQDRYHAGYSQELLHTFQQKQSRLRNFVDTIQGAGNVMYFDKKGPAVSREIVQRGAKRAPQEGTYERRAVTHHLIHAEENFDDPLDIERQLNSPQAHIVDSFKMELDRQTDNFIIAAMAGSQMVQTNNVSAAVPFDSNMEVGIASNTLAGSIIVGNSSLHEGKIEQAISLLAQNEVFDSSDGEVFVVANARQMKFLKSRGYSQQGAAFRNTNTLDVQNIGYGSALDGWAGVKNYITLNSIPQIGGNDVVYVFVRKAIRLWMVQDPTVQMFRREDEPTSPPALEAYMRIGTARAYEDGIARIICSPTAGFPAS